MDELELRLTVEDDGRGLAFAPSTTMGGHGLPNIERRVRKLGGFHEYQAAIPRGSRLRVNVPLRQGVE